jgi:hypothetical protein
MITSSGLDQTEFEFCVGVLQLPRWDETERRTRGDERLLLSIKRA